jgi:hypothetical protein
VLALVGTSSDEYIHSGLADGKTLCGQETKFDYPAGNAANCPECLQRVDAVLRFEALIDPGRVEELVEEGVAWHQGLVR